MHAPCMATICILECECVFLVLSHLCTQAKSIWFLLYSFGTGSLLELGACPFSSLRLTASKPHWSSCLCPLEYQGYRHMRRHPACHMGDGIQIRVSRWHSKHCYHLINPIRAFKVNKGQIWWSMPIILQGHPQAHSKFGLYETLSPRKNKQQTNKKP